MKLRTKVFSLITAGAIMMALLLTMVSIFAFRAYSLSSVRNQVNMAAELVLTALNQEMLGGDMEKHEELLSRLSGVSGVQNISVIPSKAVTDQFGQLPGDVHQPNELEKHVLSSGQAAEKLSERGEKSLFSVSIPYIAHSRGSINCLQCHQVSEDTVLGAVSITVDLTEQRAAAIRSVIFVVVLLVMFMLMLAYALRRLMAPIVQTTENLQAVVTEAEAGIFTSRLRKLSNDEVGDISDQTNQLMTTLEQSIGSIATEIETLTGSTANHSEKNLLKHTVDVVHNMVEAAHFKQMIESDRNLDEVYERLRHVLLTHFSLSRFSLYEVSNSKNRLKLIFAEGLPKGSEQWCEPEVLIDAEACRAKRTAQRVSSVEEAEIYMSYCGNKVQKSQDLVHVCLPMMLSGSVGGVLQVIFTAREAKKIQARLSTIQTYLDEVSPVIETKRLMASLRELAMRDAMTGLYNRRFLEEYVETLIASVERRKTSVGILMCDVDFFKQVNDSLGHEIGDSVLNGVADILKHSVRSADIDIRYGGEEFLALLIDADEEKAMEVAERIRQSMEEHVFQTASGPLSKTLSVGVSMYPADNDAFWGSVKYSDVALYKAKESGRNKVLRFTSDMWEEEESY